MGGIIRAEEGPDIQAADVLDKGSPWRLGGAGSSGLSRTGGKVSQ